MRRLTDVDRGLAGAFCALMIFGAFIPLIRPLLAAASNGRVAGLIVAVGILGFMLGHVSRRLGDWLFWRRFDRARRQ